MRTWIAWSLLSVLLLPLFIGAAAGIVVSDVGAKAQRVTMMASQATQITTLTDQLTEMREQLDHAKDSTLGQIQPLTEPFTSLASATTGLVADTMVWRNDFQGIPGQLAGALQNMGSSGTSMTATWRTLLQNADNVAEADFAQLGGGQTPDVESRLRESWVRAREGTDQKIVFSHALADAVAELTKALKGAKDSYDTVKNQSNLSNTALKQAQVTADVTGGNLDVARAQLDAFRSLKEAAEVVAAEHQRRQLNDAWMSDQQDAQNELQTRLSAIAADEDALRRGMQMTVHPAFGSSYPVQ